MPALPVRYSLMLIWLVLAACAAPKDQSAENGAKQFEAKLAVLETRISDFETVVRRAEILRKLDHDQYKTATFDPTDGSFQRLDPADGYGSFAVSVQDVRPFGDGVRVTLNLGNPWFISYNNVELKVTYAPRIPDLEDANFAEAYDGWEKTKKTKEETVLKKLEPGSWNPVQVTLPGIKADQFGYMEVSVETASISLR